MTQEERMGELADELLDESPSPEMGVTNAMIRACIKLQSDAALSLSRECGVEVP